ncbi:reverse transcriptase domain-containing protein, partial [Tanacetum coccineum]
EAYGKVRLGTHYYRIGAPQSIISDNGKQFAEGVFPVFCKGLGIHQSFISVYHPKQMGWLRL